MFICIINKKIVDRCIEVFSTLVAENYDLFCIKKYTTIINREK